MSDLAVRALLARWERGLSNLYAANEEEGEPAARSVRFIKAETIETCIAELRDALGGALVPAAASPPSTPEAEAHGEAGEVQEGSQ